MQTALTEITSTLTNFNMPYIIIAMIIFISILAGIIGAIKK